MLNNISWGSYWTAMTILCLIYYVYILVAYFGGDLKKLAISRSSAAPKNRILPDVNVPDQNITPATLTQSFADEIAAFLTQSNGSVREETLFGLQEICRKYRPILNSEYKDAVQSLLLSECKEKCAISLDESEIKQVWMG